MALTQPGFTCSKLTIETLEQGVKYAQKLSITTPEQRQWRRSGVFIVDFEHVSHLALVLLLLTLNIYMPTGNKCKEASSNKSLFQHRGRLGFTKKDVYINPSRPISDEERKLT